jgi:hypothetical protein
MSTSSVITNFTKIEELFIIFLVTYNKNTLSLMRFWIHTVVIAEGAVFLENKRPTFRKYMLFVIFWVEYGGSRFLPNVGIFQPEYMETIIKTINFILCNPTIICTKAI